LDLVLPFSIPLKKKSVFITCELQFSVSKEITDWISSLYQGHNSNGQYVYSWLASSDLTSFNADISPLLHYLWRHSYIHEANYLGIVQFGMETFHATSNVTFSATDFDISIYQGDPAPDPNSAATRSYVANLAFLWSVFTGVMLWM